MSSGFQNVHIRVNDADTGKPTPVRIRFVGADGKYYAPFGRLTEFGVGVGDDVGGNLLHGGKEYAYIDGACEIQLPVGEIEVEICKGFEYVPVHEKVLLKQGKLSMRFEIKRWIDMQKEGWYAGDTHCYYMTPHAALFEAQAEGLAVVNLLIAQTEFLPPSMEGAKEDEYHPVIPNMLAFGGQKPALESTGHLVAVNTHNRNQSLGALALLNCHRPVFPLVMGEREEPQTWNLADWCEQCHRKGGLVAAPDYLSPSADDSVGEILADIVLGHIDTLTPVLFLDDILRRWEELLHCGLRVPISAGSGKATNQQLLGFRRTYAHLGSSRELSYGSWIEAVRSGNTFVSSGPMLSLRVNGRPPGSVIDLPRAGQTVRLDAEVKSHWMIDTVQIIFNGKTIYTAEARQKNGVYHARIERKLPIKEAGWLYARCHGPSNDTLQIFAGAATSPVYFEINGQPLKPKRKHIEAMIAKIQAAQQWAMKNCRFENDQGRQRMANVYIEAQEKLRQKVP